MSDNSKIGKAVAKAIMEGVTSYHDATGMEAVNNALNNNSVHISSAEHHVPSSEEKAFRKAEALKNDERKEDRLLYAFCWRLTPEGHGYWSRINQGNIPEKPNNNNG